VARIVIVGTGGMGRETAAWIAAARPRDEVLGYLDDDPATHHTEVAGLPVLGGVDALIDGHLDAVAGTRDAVAGTRDAGAGTRDAVAGERDAAAGERDPAATVHGDIEVALAIGSPAGRAALAARLVAAGFALASVVHPAASIGPRVTSGAGAIIGPGVVLTCDITLGTAVIVNYGAMIGHDGVVGDHAFIAPGAHLAGNVHVGAQADVGIGASVIQGLRVGERAVVGAGAVVIRDVEPDTTVVGVPAAPIERHP
jgi:sugar O-acyltransferase (sialic acid O-acetyltransferase NeuD family)